MIEDREVQKRARQSLATTLWIERSIDGSTIPQGRRFELAAAALDLSFEHHRSIAELMLAARYGSAYALVRPAFEACIAGLWFFQCARDDLIARFDAATFKTDLDRMLADLDKHPDLGGQELAQFMRTEGRIFHDFTHGGAAQLERRVPADSHKTAYALKELRFTLCIADILVLMAAMAAAGVYELPQLVILAPQKRLAVAAEMQQILA